LRISEDGVDHDLQASLAIVDREHPVDLDPPPNEALPEAAGELARDGAAREAEAPARPDLLLILLANEIRAQQNALVAVPPAPRRRLPYDPAEWRLPKPMRKARFRVGATPLILAPVAAAVSLIWVPVSGSTPRHVAHLENAPRDGPIMAAALHRTPPAAKSQRPPPEAPVERNAAFRAAAPAQQTVAPSPAASPPHQRVATRNAATLRVQPEMAAPAARILPPKVILTVFRKKDDWLEVGSTYAWGWVHASFVYPYDPSSGHGPS